MCLIALPFLLRLPGFYLTNNIQFAVTRAGVMFGVVAAQILMPPLSHAQSATPPDAGSLLQQIEQGQQPMMPPAKRPAITPQPEMKPRGDLVITVTRFNLVGNTLMTEAELQPVLAPWLNRRVDFNELQKAAAAVAAAYREAGWVVRAYLPQQEIEGGVVTIQIVEAVLGSIMLEGAQNIRLKPDRVREMVLAAQRRGEPLNADAIDRVLLLIEDTPGVTVKGNFAQGRDEGQTDLVLNLDPKAFVTGVGMLDNSGSRSTGAIRGTGQVSVNSPLFIGDQLNGDLIVSQGSEYLRAGWVFPVGSRGWRAGFSASMLQYRVITPEFSALNLRGHSETIGADVNYPIIRSRTGNLYFNARLDHKTYFNEARGTATSDYAINVAGFTISGNLYDNLLGGGYTTASLGLNKGQLDLAGSPNRAADAAGARTDGAYRKTSYSANRFQVLTSELAFYAALTGQMANKNLDSGEKFYLGGSNGVRAYPSSEAGGAEGLMVNLEMRYRLPQKFSLTGFYDWGQVTVNKDNNFNGAAQINSITLKGSGVSVGWVAQSGASFKATLARRIGDNPNPTATGNDQDGSLDLNRLWWQASLPF